MDPTAELQDAVRHHRAGRVDLAEPVYRRILADHPDHPEARHLVAVLAQQRGRPAEAEADVRRAIAANPAEPKYHNTLGNALFHLGRLDEAAESFSRASTLQPSFAEAHYNLGSTLLAQGRAEDAATSFNAVLALAPAHVGARNNLGMALRALNRKGEAIAEFHKAVEVAPDHHEALFNLGVAFKDDGHRDRAIGYFRRLKGDGARVNIATCLPAIPPSVGSIDDIRAAYRQGLDGLLAETALRIDDPIREIGTVGQFYLAYHGRNDRELQEMLARFYRRAVPSLTHVAAHCRAERPRPTGRKIKVGFVSSYFHHHTIGKLSAGLVAELPRDHLHVTAFSTSCGNDALARLIRTKADRAVALPLDLTAARTLIAGAELDILIYPDIGMDPFTYFLAYARLAPVQCVTWGHPVTTGIDTVDWFLSSEHLETPDGPTHYSERLHLLRHPPTYYYRPTSPPPRDREYFNLPAEARIYACPQSLFKFHPAFDHVLAECLRRDPKALVVVIDGRDPAWMAALRARWQQVMPDVCGRIRNLPSMSQDDFMALVGLADVMLDIPQFSGGNTSLEAFHMGTPIITMPTPFLRGRPTYAFYRRMGVLSAIAQDQADYVAKAVAVAAEPRPHRLPIQETAGALYENREVLADIERFILDRVG